MPQRRHTAPAGRHGHRTQGPPASDAVTFNGQGLALYPPGADFGPRVLRDFEFVWIIAGDVVWDCNGTTHAAPAGTVILAQPGMRDGFAWDRTHSTRHGYVHFSLGTPPSDLPPPARWPHLRQMSGNDLLRPLLSHLLWLLSTRGDGWQAQATAALHLALHCFVSGQVHAAMHEGTSHHPVVERALAVLRQAWHDQPGMGLRQISLGVLARRVGVSRVHLCRVFAAELNASPGAVQRQLRLAIAAQRLARSNDAIHAVAAACGFANPYHFSRAFRAAFGQSPRQLRERLASGAHMPQIAANRARNLAVRFWAGF